MHDSIFTQIYMRTYGLTKPWVCTHDHKPLPFILTKETHLEYKYLMHLDYERRADGANAQNIRMTYFTTSGPTGQSTCWDIYTTFTAKNAGKFPNIKSIMDGGLVAPTHLKK